MCVCVCIVCLIEIVSGTWQWRLFAKLGSKTKKRGITLDVEDVQNFETVKKLGKERGEGKGISRWTGEVGA